jgi:hypothetical protein
VQAPELLRELFALGTDLLLDNLEIVWAGVAAKAAVPQDASQVGPLGYRLVHLVSPHVVGLSLLSCVALPYFDTSPPACPGLQRALVAHKDLGQVWG